MTLIKEWDKVGVGPKFMKPLGRVARICVLGLVALIARLWVNLRISACNNERRSRCRCLLFMVWEWVGR